jgi:glycosyltransferase involved in cell wall biosynthesis
LSVDDVRWFAPNRYCTLPVPELRRMGLRIACDGAAPARLAFAADNQCVTPAYEYASRHRCPLAIYLWDLPPWRLGRGRPDPVFELFGRVRRVARLIGGYPERSGFYSRMRWVAHRAARIWCPSTATTLDVRSRFGVEAELVPFCYDSDRFRPEDRAAREQPAGRPPVVLSVSRLVPHKSHAVVILAAARCTPRPSVRIVGQGPEAEALRALAATLDVSLDLACTWLSDDDVVTAYRSADVVVAPSRFEGFGLTAIEALTCGTPAIASDIPPHREFLGDRVTYVPPGDADALAAALAVLLADPERARPPAGTTPFPELTIEACARRLFPRLVEEAGAR